jgi:hypothetical protein
LRTRLVAAALLSTGLGWSITVVAKPASPVSVTSLVQDLATGVAPRLQIQSDQLGAYKNGTGLISIISTGAGQGVDINGAGDWQLDSWIAKGTRTFYLDFGQPIAGSGPTGGDPIAVPSGRYIANLLANCDLAGSNLLTQPAGSVANCPLTVEFEYSGSQYRLHMNPGITTNGTIRWPETDYMKVTCIFPSTGAKPCAQWTLEPSGTYIAPDMTVKERNVTNLSKVVSGVEMSQGDFYFSFQFVIMNP